MAWRSISLSLCSGLVQTKFNHRNAMTGRDFILVPAAQFYGLYNCRVVLCAGTLLLATEALARSSSTRTSLTRTLSSSERQPDQSPNEETYSVETDAGRNHSQAITGKSTVSVTGGIHSLSGKSWQHWQKWSVEPVRWCHPPLRCLFASAACTAARSSTCASILGAG